MIENSVFDNINQSKMKLIPLFFEKVNPINNNKIKIPEKVINKNLSKE